MSRVMRQMFTYSPEGKKLDPQWVSEPVPITEPFDVWLDYPSSGLTILASVEPTCCIDATLLDDLSDVLAEAGCPVRTDEVPSQQFVIAYTTSHSDGTTVDRTVMWRFASANGLIIGAEEPDYLDEAVRVGAHILGAIYQDTTKRSRTRCPA